MKCYGRKHGNQEDQALDQVLEYRLHELCRIELSV